MFTLNNYTNEDVQNLRELCYGLNGTQPESTREGSSTGSRSVGEIGEHRSASIGIVSGEGGTTGATCDTGGGVGISAEREQSDRRGNCGAVRYICFQPEIGESGTKHLQGCICFTTLKSLAGVKAYTGNRSHVEPMRGTFSEARAYCQKADSADASAGFGFTEGGVPPLGVGVQGGRSDIASICELVKQGKRPRELFEYDGSSFVKYWKGLSVASTFYVKQRTEKTFVRWYYGPTGKGKSKAAFERSQEFAEDQVYWKDTGSKWWDHYHGQSLVIMDDYRPSFSTFAFMLNLLDRYPLRVEFKGGMCNFNSIEIIITTPKHPSQTWQDLSDEKLDQLFRRINEIKEFN